MKTRETSLVLDSTVFFLSTTKPPLPHTHTLGFLRLRRCSPHSDLHFFKFRKIESSHWKHNTVATTLNMFYSQSFLSRYGPLGSIWVAAYCFKKLKKSQVKDTDISSSVDKILHDEFDVVTYRILAYLLLGIVRIYSKKVEYLYDDCNKVLLKIKDYMIKFKDSTIMETLQAPYFSITLPERFELDAFDLDILEDATGYNVVPHEEITLKEGIWKSGKTGRCSLEKDYAAFHDDIPGEDFLSSHHMDFEMEVGTSYNKYNLQAGVERLRDNLFFRQECEDAEMFSVAEEEPPIPVNLSIDNHQAEEEHTDIPETVSLDKVHVEASRQEILDSSLCQEASVNFKTMGGIEKESSNPFSEHNQNDDHEMDVQDMEVHGASGEHFDLSDVEAIIEKLRRGSFSQEVHTDTKVFSTVEGAPVNVGPLGGERQSNVEHNKISEMNLSENGKSAVVTEDQPPSTILDATPQSKFRGGERQSNVEHNKISEMNLSENGKSAVVTEDQPPSTILDATPQSKFRGNGTPELSVIHTPAVKERSQIKRKRNCCWDDVIVFPNHFIKKCINDSSSLVSKRRKVPCTALAAWRSNQVSDLPHCFLKPLIPCSSLDLCSLCSLEKVKIPELVEPVEVSRKILSNSPAIGRSAEPVETLEKMAVSELGSAGAAVENTEPIEKLDASLLRPIGRPVEPSVELDVPAPSGAVGSLDQMPIAPETPIRQTTVLRSFDSPERPETYNSDVETVNKGPPSPCKDQEFDFSLINKEMNLCEGDKYEDQYGWSERTRLVAKCLLTGFQNQRKHGEHEAVNLSRLLDGRTKKESARIFYEILVLKSKGFVLVKQENAYDDILVSKTLKWDQVFGPESL